MSRPALDVRDSMIVRGTPSARLIGWFLILLKQTCLLLFESIG